MDGPFPPQFSRCAVFAVLACACAGHRALKSTVITLNIESFHEAHAKEHNILMNMMPMIAHSSMKNIQLTLRSRCFQSKIPFIVRCLGSSSDGPAIDNNSPRRSQERQQKRDNAYNYIWEIPAHQSQLREKSDHRGTLYRSIVGNENKSNAWNVVKGPKHQDENYDKDTAFISIAETFQKCQDKVLQHLLPAGYPSSVQSGYSKYVSYCFLANTASTITMVLSTQTLLLAIGVGTQHAAPISATLNWIIKDGIGQFGGILFASKISVQTTTSIDSDPKRWRMVSAVAMDCAMMMELATIAFPSGSSSGSFLLLASVANIGKNIAFLTASASRAKLHQSLTKKDNLGDVTGKATSQSIVASLIGTGIGIAISPLLLGDGSDFWRVGIGCFFLAGVHEFCTYNGLKSVVMKKLNRHRLEILLSLYFQKHGVSERNNLISPEAISQRENFLPFPFSISTDVGHAFLHLGCGVNKLAPGGSDELRRLHRDGENYILNCSPSNVNGHDSGDSVEVFVTFFDNACGSDMLRAMFQAHCIQAYTRDEIDFNTSNSKDCDLVTLSHQYTNENFDEFIVNLSQAGWSFDGDEIIALESSSAVRLKITEK